MICIVINHEPMAGKVIAMLISQTEDLTWLASFSNIFEASAFMSKNDVDVMFLDVQTDETKGYQFVKTIPRETFVIFISEFSSAVIGAHKTDVAIGSKLLRFQQGVDKARAYCKAVKQVV